MPYIQFDLDALEDAPHCAQAAGLTEETVIAGLLKLWRYAWRKKSAEVQREHLMGFFGGDGERVVKALTAFEFIAPLDGGDMRIRGAEKRLGIREKQAEGARKTNEKRKRNRGVSGDLATGQQQTSDGPPSVDRGSTARNIQQPAANSQQPTATEPSSTGATAPFDGDGFNVSEASGFWSWHDAIRQAHGLFPETYEPDGYADWFAATVAELQGDGVPLSYAFERFLGDSDFADGGHAFEVFMRPKVWRKRASQEPPGPRYDPLTGVRLDR